VIEEGTVDVYVDGLLRREQGPGEYFGEIALLRGGVRTATVRATTPVAVVAVARNDFLESIGSHARSTHVAETASWPSGSPRRPGVGLKQVVQAVDASALPCFGWEAGAPCVRLRLRSAWFDQ
jgi:hypothetical protein